MVEKKERQLCQVMTRCCGWLVPRHVMNPGKLREVLDRVNYSVDEKDFEK